MMHADASWHAGRQRDALEDACRCIMACHNFICEHERSNKLKAVKLSSVNLYVRRIPPILITSVGQRRLFKVLKKQSRSIQLTRSVETVALNWKKIWQ